MSEAYTDRLGDFPPLPREYDGWDGGTVWGVRWNEKGIPDRCREYGDEEQARSMHAHLTKRYEELGRQDRPQLIAAHIRWYVVPEATEL